MVATRNSLACSPSLSILLLLLLLSPSADEADSEEDEGTDERLLKQKPNCFK